MLYCSNAMCRPWLTDTATHEFFQRFFQPAVASIPESVLDGVAPAAASYLGAIACGQWFRSRTELVIECARIEQPDGIADIRAYASIEKLGKRVVLHKSLVAALPGLPVQLAAFLIGADACIVGHVDDVAFERADSLWLHAAQLEGAAQIAPKIAPLRKRIFVVPIYAVEIARWQQVARAELLTIEGVAAERVERARSRAERRLSNPNIAAAYHYSRSYPDGVNPLLNALRLA